MATMNDIDACVFDAYGTLFDFAAAAARYKDELGDKEKPLSDMWRVRQLEYTWLRSLMGEYVEFWQVTQDALDYSMSALDIEDVGLREKLLDMYWELDAFPEVPDMLKTLKAGGMKTAVLTNGSPDMVQGAIDSAGIGDVLDASFSVDSVKIFKPHPSVYQMVPDTFDVGSRRVCFMSSNAWDAAAAANFGFRVVWINRYGQPPENIPGNHEHELKSLEGLPALLGL
ncbi:MAG: haloacid dehalogenase type II [Rhodospirillaceae bacterium]|nr:haloacid dehalogenase type II [Rhodospirillaceae bacterium]MBT5516176.1 haloacid dehalogenase type II [Rhodospirillaceae bacterium]MBT6087529.1 haloacid dehalogenase type II [Rhodospirillaceae bacterium]MBT6609351.1 haloacid dehalogenase type II [Rhodospirillaceae bacterium]MBT7250190.1 haloacid dehalogenase type II [Rhodospirillaceae bacterium]